MAGDKISSNNTVLQNIKTALEDSKITPQECDEIVAATKGYGGVTDDELSMAKLLASRFYDAIMTYRLAPGGGPLDSAALIDWHTYAAESDKIAATNQQAISQIYQRLVTARAKMTPWQVGLMRLINMQL